MALSCGPPPPAAADPFGERGARCPALDLAILGGRFHFTSDSEALLRLVESAYGGLPQNGLPGTTPEFRIELRLVSSRTDHRGEPPRVRQHSGAGLLCGVMDENNYVMLDPHGGRALVVASQSMLDYPYHLRYELIEFAVFTLATRGRGLVPLHGACVGHAGRGVLLLGASGAGKSTLALHSLLGGLELLAEDAVFVQPDSLYATGVPNFLHLQPDALRQVVHGPIHDWLAQAPRIRRRSGVEKIEADLRRGPHPPATAALQLVGAVFVRAIPATAPGQLRVPLSGHGIAARLAADQAYASGQPGWAVFVQGLIQRGVHELHRGNHPEASVEVLRELLG